MSAQVSKQGAAAGQQGQEKNMALREIEQQGAADAKGEKKGGREQEVAGEKTNYSAHCLWSDLSGSAADGVQ